MKYPHVRNSVDAPGKNHIVAKWNLRGSSAYQIILIRSRRNYKGVETKHFQVATSSHGKPTAVYQDFRAR